MNNDREQLSERFSVDDYEESILKRNKKRYQSLNLAALLEEADQKIAEVERHTRESIESDPENEVDVKEEADFDIEKEDEEDNVEYTGESFEREERDF